MAKAEVMYRLQIFHLSDAKESKEDNREGRGDAEVANLLTE